MKKCIHNIIILFFLTTCVSCLNHRKGDDPAVEIHENYTINDNSKTTIEIRFDTTSEIVNKDGVSPQVTFYGKVLNEKTKEPEIGVRIRIVGTDTPGGQTVSKSDGTWELLIPIVPDRNDENFTMFAFEVQKNGAGVTPLSEYCKEPVVWDLLGVKEPNTYMVVGAFSQSLPWGNLYSRIECPISIRMKD